MYSQTYPCPNCGAAVPFASAITVSAVCGFCRSLVVRRDAQVELMGLQAQLPPDISPLQVGTRGEFDGHAFTLVGRVRVGYREGSWNEWCADFGGGRWGWVAEAQGVYEVSFEVAPPEDLPGMAEWKGLEQRRSGDLSLQQARISQGRSELKVGRSFRFQEADYQVRDVKQTEVLGAEGELTFTPLAGRSAISGDLRGPGASFANLEYSEDGIRLFLGRTCRFSELKFQDLRPLPGWTADARVVRGQADPINCPQCGAATELKAAGLSMTCVCGNCGSLLDTSHPRVQLLDIASKRQHQPLVIPIGRRGTLNEVEYECIGYLLRRDSYGDKWGEYLLFSPWAGFRWLVTYGGHWTLVETLIEAPREVEGDPVVDGQPYTMFSQSQAQVVYVLGEFYWQVRLRERTDVADYIHPPGVLSVERYPDLAEVTWSHGLYQDPSVVYRAFAIGEEPPHPTGAYLNQPNPHREKGRTLRSLVPLFAFAFVLICLGGAATKANERVFDGSWGFVGGASNAPVVTAPFEISGTHPQALEIQLRSEVANGWLGTGVDLVNANTQAVRELEIGVEFYSGYDEGAWQEGSHRASVLVPGVAPGRYYLVIEPEGQPGLSEVTYQLTVVRDVMVWSNFWIGLLPLLAYPVFRWVREHAFERERWSANDLSPYTPVSEWVETSDDD
jgi:Domain of unknown function (DUF4178)